MLGKQARNCHVEGCNGKATPSDLSGMDQTIHFDCDKGHKYHTNYSQTHVFLCECGGLET